jgi:hypothetical protein
MLLFAKIKKKLSVLKNCSKKNVKEVQLCQSEDLIERQSRQATLASFFDSMGPATANIIIKKRIDKYIYAVCGIEELKNNKRFYITRETEASGSIIKTSLVDKQNEMTRTLYYRSVDRPSP